MKYLMCLVLMTSISHAKSPTTFDGDVLKLKARYETKSRRAELKAKQKTEREALKMKQKAERDSLKTGK